jgi:lyso-ornithine lipid O-acyltransferase
VRLRPARRAVALGLALAISILRYWLIRIRGPLSLDRRADWLHESCRRVVKSVGVLCRVVGTPPCCGLVVSNHLSYLDIAIFSSVMPCMFVAKAEIDRWPYFGRAARAAGTLFIDRTSVASAQRVAAEMVDRLRLPVPILFFPEGTSTDGRDLLRFHSGLFEPAVRAGAPVTAAAVRYFPADGGAEAELCWYGNESFLPNLWKVLGAPGLMAELRFGEPRLYRQRRDAALQTRAEVTVMRAAHPLIEDRL